MGFRYYCDYCEKMFIDEADSRRKHLNSAHHIKLRRLHYEAVRFQDPRELLKEEAGKITCRRFMSNGFCHFESNCIYTHYSPEQLWELKQQVLNDDRERELKRNEVIEVPTVDSWLLKYGQQQNSIENHDHVPTFWTYPEHMENRTDLPMSLRKFEPAHFVEMKFDEWGS